MFKTCGYSVSNMGNSCLFFDVYPYINSGKNHGSVKLGYFYQNFNQLMSNFSARIFNAINLLIGSYKHFPQYLLKLLLIYINTIRLIKYEGGR